MKCPFHLGMFPLSGGIFGCKNLGGSAINITENIKRAVVITQTRRPDALAINRSAIF